MAETKRNIVKWFNTEKGYGFISSPAGDVFVHYRSIEPGTEGFKNLDEGDEVEYTELNSAKGLQAAEVSIIQRANNQPEWRDEQHGNH